MTGPRAAGISLWLVPDGDPGRELTRRIAELAAHLDTPAFEPHLTLLGGLMSPADAVLARTRDLASALAPLRVRFRRVEGTEEYYRCLFLEVEPDPPLREAHREARRRLAARGDDAFRPHLSLVYAALPSDRRAQIAAGLAGLPGELVTSTLAAVATEGPPNEWRVLERHVLHGP